jgi:hypothetical protein
MKRGYGRVVFLFSIMLLVLGLNSAFVNAQVVNCQFMGGMHCNAFAGSSLIGWVTHDGHFSNVSIPGTRAVCCRNVDIGTGTPSFNYSTDGHVSVRSTTTNFFHNVSLGFQDTCNVQSTACNNAVGEMCIFRVNTTGGVASNSHIAECTSGDLDSNLCCRIAEDCSNGIDDDGDGFIDCADEECHDDLKVLASPPSCTGSTMTSDFCVSVQRNHLTGTYVPTYNPLCAGQAPPTGDPTLPNFYYCSTMPTGPMIGQSICCQSGMKAEYDAALGWRCTDSEVCGLDVSEECKKDFDTEFNPWIEQPYNGNIDNWCYSKIPNLFTNYAPFSMRSTACCLMVKDGFIDYHTDDNNIKVYGTT